jgi:hypothetical protein
MECSSSYGYKNHTKTAYYENPLPEVFYIEKQL